MDAHKAPLTDAELVAQARHDASAFGELYRRHAAAIHRYHRRCTGDEDAALDLAAEAFAQAWLVRTRFRDEMDGSATPWLYGIARNVLLMSVRRRATLAALKREIAAAHVTRVVFFHKGESMTAGKDGTITVAPDPNPPATNWTGAAEPSVDPTTKRVNGGCRGLNAAGTEWECYIGEAAVQQQIISQGFLGQYVPYPGVG